MIIPYQKIVYSLCVGLLGACCFFSSIYGSFVFDDTEAILNNKDVDIKTPLFEIFKNDFWGTRLTDNLSHKSYRPLTILSFRLNVLLSNGKLNPFGFHITNIVLHSIICCMTVPVFLTIFNRFKNGFTTALISSMLFAVLPVHTEAVAGIVGRADLLCTMFSLCSYLIYCAACQRENPLSVLFLSFLSAVCSMCAMFSKEQGVTILGVCFAYDLFIINQFYPYTFIERVLPNSKFKKKIELNKKGLKLFLFRVAILVITSSCMVYLRYYLMGFEGPTFHFVDNPASFNNDFFTRVINYNYIYAMNFWILVCPEWLCFDWSMGCVPLIKLSSFIPDVRLFVVFIFWFIMIVFSVQIFSKNINFLSVLLMGLAFLIIPFFIASNILFRVGFVIAERILYLPSIGYCAITAYGLHLLYTNSKYKAMVQWSFVFLLLINILRCHSRTLDWISERSLFESGVRVCPKNAKVHYNLAKTSHNTSESIVHYRTALRLYPDYEQAMNNLANILRDLGNSSEAEDLLKKAVSIRKHFPAAWMNLGIVLSNRGKYDEALEAYLTALKYRKFYPDCHYNLGNLFLSQKRYEEAYQSWRKATIQKNTHSVAWNNMIVMLDSMGDLRRAEQVGKEALKYLPDDSSLHFNLGNTLGKMGNFEKAEIHFKKAISLKSDQSLYHTNLGVLYHRWKKYKLAEEHYTTALQINPNSNNAYQNLKVIQKFL